MKRDPYSPSSPRRPLQLRKERIRELATETLDQIVGGKRVEIKTGLCNATTI